MLFIASNRCKGSSLEPGIQDGVEDGVALSLEVPRTVLSPVMTIGEECPQYVTHQDVSDMCNDNDNGLLSQRDRNTTSLFDDERRGWMEELERGHDLIHNG